MLVVLRVKENSSVSTEEFFCSYHSFLATSQKWTTPGYHIVARHKCVKLKKIYIWQTFRAYWHYGYPVSIAWTRPG